MRVLHLTRDLAPRVNGGLSTAVAGLVTASSEVGLDCAVVSFDGWRPKARGGPRDEAHREGNVLRIVHPTHLEAAARFVDAFAPDVVHVHQAMLFEHAEVFAPGRPTVLSVHVVQSTLRRLRGLDAATMSERAQLDAMERATVTTAPSRSALEELRAVHPEACLRLAPLGLERSIAPPPTDQRVVLYVGRFNDIKGTAELIEAIPHIDARFLIAGGLPDNPRAEAKWRERLSHPRVELLGWLDRAALETAYRRAALLIAPSWTETFGLAVAEAMMRGRPVVASDAGALRERVRDTVDGRLVPPRNPAAIAAAVNELLEDPARKRYGERARESALRWTWHEQLPHTLAAYDEAKGA